MFSDFKICLSAHAAKLLYLPEKLVYKLTQFVSFTNTLNDYEDRICTSRGNMRRFQEFFSPGRNVVNYHARIKGNFCFGLSPFPFSVA
jgi:hypothetical protein